MTEIPLYLRQYVVENIDPIRHELVFAAISMGIKAERERVSNLCFAHERLFYSAVRKRNGFNMELDPAFEAGAIEACQAIAAHVRQGENDAHHQETN